MSNRNESQHIDTIPRLVVQQRTEIYYHALYQISDTLQHAHELCEDVEGMEIVCQIIALQVERLAEKLIVAIALDDV